MTHKRYKSLLALRDIAYTNGWDAEVKRMDKEIDEYHEQDMAKAREYMAAHRLTVPREYFLRIGQDLN